jgi:hypothetical protein
MSPPHAMKNFSRFLPRAAAAVCLLSPVAAIAQGPPPSNFEAVARHLDPGGVFYTIIDIDGDLVRFAGMGDAMMELIREEAGGAIPPGLSAKGMLRSMGLDGVKAIGMSSKKSGADLFENRAMVYIPEGRVGFFKMFGGAATPLQSPAFAPAGSDVVMEWDVTLGAVLEMAENVVKSTGDDQMMQQFKGMLGFPVPGLEMTAGDLIAKLNTRILVAGRLEKGKNFTPPDSPIALPAFRLVVSLDHLDFLFPAMLDYASQMKDEVVVEKGEGFELIRPAQPLPEEMAFLKPVLYHDLKSKRILLGTHQDAVKECLAGKKTLSTDPAFLQATAGLPKEGNEFSYITPAIFQTIQKATTKAMSLEAGADLPNAKLLRGIMEQMRSLTAPPEKALAGVRANLPEGMIFHSNSNQSFKSILPAAIIFPVAAMSAVGFGAMSKTMELKNMELPARETKPSATEKALDAEEDDGSSKTIKSNLQQIAFAAQSYFVDHADATEVSYQQLIDAELLFRLKPVSGESYKDVKLKKAGGTLTVKTSDGSAVKQPYGPVTD